MTFPTGATTGAPLDLASTTARVQSQALAIDTAADLTADDSGKAFILNPDAAPLGQALPPVDADAIGFTVTIVNIDDANAVNVTSGTDNFNGAAGPVAIPAGESRTFIAVQFDGGAFGYAVVGA